MRVVASVLVCAGLVLALAGCDPTTERRYFTEGAGVDLYTADRAQQVELQNQYITFVCDQAGANCGGNWTTFVQAGMNDIDLRCDGFLTWLDAQRRDKEPILAELSALNTATHAVMTVSGASPKSLDIVTAAFGLATATYTNWNSRLLLAINQSTVQEVVYIAQGKFRDKIKSYTVPDQPTAIYLLRNYLRLCMPTTIEANINVSAALVQRDPMAAKETTVVKQLVPNRVTRVHTTIMSDDARVALTKFIYPNGTLGALNEENANKVQAYLDKNKIEESVPFFLRSPKYAAQREALARELKLIR